MNWRSSPKSDPPITILVKADEVNNYGAVMEVLKELHTAKITRIALLTQEESPPKLGAEMSTIEKQIPPEFRCRVHCSCRDHRRNCCLRRCFQ